MITITGHLHASKSDYNAHGNMRAGNENEEPHKKRRRTASPPTGPTGVPAPALMPCNIARTWVEGPHFSDGRHTAMMCGGGEQIQDGPRNMERSNGRRLASNKAGPLRANTCIETHRASYVVANKRSDSGDPTLIVLTSLEDGRV